MSGNKTQVVEFNDKFLYSLSQLSTAFGPARETISKRLKNGGVLPAGKRSNYDVFKIGEAARAILADEMPSFEKIKDPDALHPKDRLDYYKGNTEKWKNMQDAGQLVLVEQATSEMASIVKICVRTLDRIPDMLEMKCGLSPSEILLVEGECDKAREDLAEKLAE